MLDFCRVRLMRQYPRIDTSSLSLLQMACRMVCKWLAEWLAELWSYILPKGVLPQAEIQIILYSSFNHTPSFQFVRLPWFLCFSSMWCYRNSTKHLKKNTCWVSGEIVAKSAPWFLCFSSMWCYWNSSKHLKKYLLGVGGDCSKIGSLVFMLFKYV